MEKIFQATVYDEPNEEGGVYISIKKKLNKKGNPVHNFNLLPRWNTNYKDIYLNKDNVDFMDIINDTLNLYKPIICIIYKSNSPKKPKCNGNLMNKIIYNDDNNINNKSGDSLKTCPKQIKKTTKLKRVYGRVIATKSYKNDSSGKHYEDCNLHLYIKLNKGEQIDKHLSNFKIKIQSNLLPYPYQYGFCNKLDGAYHICSNKDYFINAENSFLFKNIERCKLFNLENGNPEQYCDFKYT